MTQRTAAEADLRVQVVARHCELPDSVRQRAEDKISRLVKYDSRIAAAEVIFHEERRARRVEAILSVPRADAIVAKGEGDDFRSALDKVVDRLSRILRRRRDQSTDRQGPRLSEGVTGV